MVDPEDVLVDVVPGSPGELLVRTPTMMAGYWNRPDLTAASIIERPSATGGGDRWYRTGDLVVERPDGNLEFLGRIDNQIKLRGHRIELEAIDAVLADIAELQMATVVVRRSEESRQRRTA